MKHWAQCAWAHRGIDYVVRHLGSRSHQHDLVLKKRAIGVIRMPEFGIENLIERARFERVRRGETNKMTTKITRHVCVTHIGQSADGDRTIRMLSRRQKQNSHQQYRKQRWGG